MDAGTKDASRWERERERLMFKVEQTLQRFRQEARSNAMLHQLLSVLLLLLTILTPVASSKAASQGAPWWWGELVIWFSVGVALVEGLRRLQRPDARWRTTAFAVQEIVGAREEFRKADAAFTRGSAEWVDAFSKFGLSYQSAIKRDMEDFFANLKDDKPKPPQPQAQAQAHHI